MSLRQEQENPNRQYRNRQISPPNYNSYTLCGVGILLIFASKPYLLLVTYNPVPAAHTRTSNLRRNQRRQSFHISIYRNNQVSKNFHYTIFLPQNLRLELWQGVCRHVYICVPLIRANKSEILDCK